LEIEPTTFLFKKGRAFVFWDVQLDTPVAVPSTLIFSFGKNRQKNRLHYNPSNIPPFGIPVGKGDSFS
jgi:hypothetical protein